MIEALLNNPLTWILTAAALFFGWIASLIYRQSVQIKNCRAFKEGTYAPLVAARVKELVGNLTNYDLPKQWSEHDKFTCFGCCCHKLKFTYKTRRIITFIKKEAKKEALALLRSVKLVDSSFDSHDFDGFQYFPAEGTMLDFNYLEAVCASCGKSAGNYNISAGKCGEVEHDAT